MVNLDFSPGSNPWGDFYIFAFLYLLPIYLYMLVVDLTKLHFAVMFYCWFITNYGDEDLLNNGSVSKQVY